jgi:hypothetical protein
VVGCHTILRGHWYDISLTVHAVTEDKCDDTRNNCYGEPDYVFSYVPNYQMKIC